MKVKKLPQKTYENMGRADIYSIMPYHPRDFIVDCKSYIKALKAGRVVFVEVASTEKFVNMFIRSYEGTKKKGNYRDYNAMLVTLGFDYVDGADDYILLPVEEGSDAILTRIYELGLIKEEKYTTLVDYY